MTGFEAFDVRSWMDSVLTIWDNRFARPAAQTFKAKAVKSAAAAAITVAVATIAAPSAATSWSTEISATRSARTNVDYGNATEGLAPPGYWAQLVDRMQRWEPLAEEPNLRLPDPLI
jgi:hypothetical protein